MNHVYRRGRAPEITSRWNVEALAEGRDVSPIEDRGADAILGAIQAQGYTQRVPGSPAPDVGDIVMVDGRWHRVDQIVTHRGRPRLKISDLAIPDMPPHAVAWSEVSHFALARDLFPRL